jgi:hypothetical protein
MNEVERALLGRGGILPGQEVQIPLGDVLAVGVLPGDLQSRSVIDVPDIGGIEVPVREL